jgi:hypothetical protein
MLRILCSAVILRKEYQNQNLKGLGSPQAIEVTDVQINQKTSYNSISEAARALNISNHKIISNYIKNNQQTPYKGHYVFKKIG